MKSKVQQSPEESIPPLWRNRFCWLPIGGALITLIPTQLVIRNLWQGFPPLKLPEIGNLEEIPFFVADLDARTFYLLSLLLLVVSAIVAIIATGYIISRFLKETYKKQRPVWAVLLLIAISIAVWLPKDHHKPVFEKIVGTIEKAEKDKGYPPLFSTTQSTADVISNLAAIGIVMVVAAFGASLHTPKNKNSRAHAQRQLGPPASGVDRSSAEPR